MCKRVFFVYRGIHVSAPRHFRQAGCFQGICGRTRRCDSADRVTGLSYAKDVGAFRPSLVPSGQRRPGSSIRVDRYHGHTVPRYPYCTGYSASVLYGPTNFVWRDHFRSVRRQTKYVATRRWSSSIHTISWSKRPRRKPCWSSDKLNTTGSWPDCERRTSSRRDFVTSE